MKAKLKDFNVGDLVYYAYNWREYKEPKETMVTAVGRKYVTTYNGRFAELPGEAPFYNYLQGEQAKLFATKDEYENYLSRRRLIRELARKVDILTLSNLTNEQLHAIDRVISTALWVKPFEESESEIIQ